MVTVARNPAQITRLRREYENEQSWDPSSEYQLLDRDGLSRYVNVTGASDGLFNQNAARVHPAKLVRGVACATEQLGVKIFEETPVTEIRPGAAKTPLGTVRSHAIIDCLEGFNSTLDSDDGTVIPLNSAMIVTDPIPQAAWNAIGWPSSTLVGDTAHAFMYALRTADGRIALGGRGVPYRFGSRTDRHGITQRHTVRQLVAVLLSMFPGPAVSRSRTPGVGCSEYAETGPRPSATTQIPGWDVLAAMWATVSPRPTWPVGR